MGRRAAIVVFALVVVCIWLWLKQMPSLVKGSHVPDESFKSPLSDKNQSKKDRQAPTWKARGSFQINHDISLPCGEIEDGSVWDANGEEIGKIKSHKLITRYPSGEGIAFYQYQGWIVQWTEEVCKKTQFDRVSFSGKVVNPQGNSYSVGGIRQSGEKTILQPDGSFSSLLPPWPVTVNVWASKGGMVVSQQLVVDARNTSELQFQLSEQWRYPTEEELEEIEFVLDVLNFPCNVTELSEEECLSLTCGTLLGPDLTREQCQDVNQLWSENFAMILQMGTETSTD